METIHKVPVAPDDVRLFLLMHVCSCLDVCPVIAREQSTSIEVHIAWLTFRSLHVTSLSTMLRITKGNCKGQMLISSMPFTKNIHIETAVASLSNRQHMTGTNYMAASGVYHTVCATIVWPLQPEGLLLALSVKTTY